MDYEQIEVEDRGLVRLITLSRPEKLNAWTRRMNREMTHAIDEGNGDVAIGAFVFTGAGRGFCAGADISDEFASGRTSRNLEGRDSDGAASPDSSDRAHRSDSEGGGRDWVELIRASKPMVAAVNGAAVGVGLTMILPMDFLIAAESAKLSARFVRMGLVPELASSHYLVQRCGWGTAGDLALSGRMVPAPEAADIGLVDAMCGDDELLDVAIARAESYGRNPPAAVRMIKELLTANGADTDLKAVQKRELARLAEALRSDDHAEAVAAFMEKREPNFR